MLLYHIKEKVKVAVAIKTQGDCHKFGLSISFGQLQLYSLMG